LDQHTIIAIGVNLGVKGGFLCDLKGFIPSLKNFPSAATIVSTYQGRPGQWHQWPIKRTNFEGNVIAFLPLKMAEMTRIENVTGLSMRVTTKNITVSSTTAEHLFSSIVACPLRIHHIAFSQRLDEAMLPETYQQIWTFVRRYDVWTLTTGDLQIQWLSTLPFTFPFAEIRWGLIYVTNFIIAGGAYILLLQMRSTTYLKTFFERDLFSKIFHNAPVGITVTNEHFRIIYANQADLAQHGFSSINEILNASSNIYAPPQYRSDIIASTPTEPFIRESINYRKTDGNSFPVRLKSIALHEAENNQLLGIVTFCEDISEEVTRRDELLELNRNYELLANQVTNFLMAQTHGHDGKPTT
jgi:PAS domain S-box-containing protein